MNQPPQQAPYPYPQPPAAPKGGGMPGWVLGCLIGGGALVFIGGILAVLAISGTRRYIANAKQAEVRNSIGQMAKDAAAAYETDKKLCASASSPVPATVPHGGKYQSAPSDWNVDEARKAGFWCLKFQMDMPQYYQYDYKSTGASFEAIGHGDLDGDMQESTFKVTGQEQSGMVVIAPTILEVSPDE
jgi:type IV pilus assembly protein PilA